MNWADAHGVSYLAWGWLALPQPQDCSVLYLITDGSTGTPADPNGVALLDRLTALTAAPSGGSASTSTTSASPTTSTTTPTTSTTTPTTSTTTPTTSTTTPTTSTTTPTTPTATSTTTTRPARLSMTLGTLMLVGRRLEGDVRTPRAFTGRIAIEVTVGLAAPRSARRLAFTRTLLTHASVRRGRCDFTITLPHRARVRELVVRYRGGRRYAASWLIRLADLPSSVTR